MLVNRNYSKEEEVYFSMLWGMHFTLSSKLEMLSIRMSNSYLQVLKDYRYDCGSWAQLQRQVTGFVGCAFVIKDTVPFKWFLTYVTSGDCVICLQILSSHTHSLAVGQHFLDIALIFIVPS